MKILSKILGAIDKINDWCGNVFCYLVIVLMFVVFYDVVMRYFFHRPSIWGFEITSLLLMAIGFLGGGFALKRGVHVRVDILYAKFSDNIKALTDCITYLLVFIFCIVLIKDGGKIAWASFIAGRTSTSVWGPPIWIWQILPVIGAILLLLQALAKWIRDFNDAFIGARELQKTPTQYEGILIGVEKNKK